VLWFLLRDMSKKYEVSENAVALTSFQVCRSREKSIKNEKAERKKSASISILSWPLSLLILVLPFSKLLTPPG